MFMFTQTAHNQLIEFRNTSNFKVLSLVQVFVFDSETRKILKNRKFWL